jgi:hypothetical protein
MQSIKISCRDNSRRERWENLVVSQTASRKTPAIVLPRAGHDAQPVEKIGGKGGNRTLDPGIMSAEAKGSGV